MLKPLRVLIVDDYEPYRRLLSRLLSHYDDLAVECAATGEDAITISVRQLLDVVVMDSAMPGMGGIAATRWLVHAIPGVYIVGHSGHEDSSRMRAAGAAAFVQKGSPPSALLDAIRAGRRLDDASSY